MLLVDYKQNANAQVEWLTAVGYEQPDEQNKAELTSVRLFHGSSTHCYCYIHRKLFSQVRVSAGEFTGLQSFFAEPPMSAEV